MFKSILSLGRRPNQRITDALYGEIVASARQPTFYSEWGVSDTPLGRFEMLCVHMFLFLDRAKGSTTALADVAQDMTDEFFKDVEHSLRELGIGDLGVPKRMKKLAKMFYGRAEAYREALAAGDTPALTAALARNIGPEREVWPEAAHIAIYVERSSALLATQPDDELLAGRVVFPNAGEGAGKA